MKLTSNEKSAILKSIKSSINALPTPILVESAIELSSTNASALEKVFSQQYPNVRIENKVNPELIAGLRIFVAGKQYDYSLSAALQI